MHVHIHVCVCVCLQCGGQGTIYVGWFSGDGTQAVSLAAGPLSCNFEGKIFLLCSSILHGPTPNSRAWPLSGAGPLPSPFCVFFFLSSSAVFPLLLPIKAPYRKPINQAGTPFSHGLHLMGGVKTTACATICRIEPKTPYG